jgi:anti-anti-sigma regulatory factor
MLRISATKAAGGAVTLQLDGRLTGQWVELLKGTCEVRLKENAHLIIDMKNVSFVDRDGFVLLKSLADRRVELLNILPFIAEQIRKAVP